MQLPQLDPNFQYQPQNPNQITCSPSPFPHVSHTNPSQNSISFQNLLNHDRPSVQLLWLLDVGTSSYCNVLSRCKIRSCAFHNNLLFSEYGFVSSLPLWFARTVQHAFEDGKHFENDVVLCSRRGIIGIIRGIFDDMDSPDNVGGVHVSDGGSNEDNI